MTKPTLFFACSSIYGTNTTYQLADGRTRRTPAPSTPSAPGPSGTPGSRPARSTAPAPAPAAWPAPLAAPMQDLVARAALDLADEQAAR